MLPLEGTGSVKLSPIFPAQEHGTTLPHPLYPHHERNIQYQLATELSDHGECYLEVDFGNGPIDLVWVDESRCGDNNHRRTVGIEIKRKFDPADLRRQINRYTDSEPEANFAMGSDNIYPDVDLLDGFWLVVAGGKKDKQKDIIDDLDHLDGELAYNRRTGRLEYEITNQAASPLERVSYQEMAGTEQMVGALLWDYYQRRPESPEKLVAAEVRTSRPASRRILHNNLEFRQDEMTLADLVLGDNSLVNEFSNDSNITALEIKAGDQINKSRAIDQLETYAASGLFSCVFLTVTEELFKSKKSAIEEILNAVLDEIGLRVVRLRRERTQLSIDTVRDVKSADRLDYNGSIESEDCVAGE